ncbi:MAG: glutamate dehydrogenase, partial [Micromonosporaceae bacterium]|nr:glutamate dehydrogenase [Micromonosporaceae bacterium]
PALWEAIESLDNKVPTAAQTTLQLETRRLIDRAVRWLVTNRRSPIDVTSEINRLRPGVQALLPALDRLFCGRELRSVREHAAALTELGIPSELADRANRVMYSFGLLDVVEVAHAAGRDLDEVAAVYYVLSDRFRVDDLLSRISALPREDRWQTLARMALRYDLYAALAALTGEVLAASTASASAEDKVLHWEHTNAPSISRARSAMAEFDDSRADLASLSVLLRQIRTLVRASAA